MTKFKVFSEIMVNTNEYGGTIDILISEREPKATASFDSLFHTYTLNGKIIPSVTQLLDDGSYVNVDEEILKYAQEKGTIVHEEIENYLKDSEKHHFKGFTSEFSEFVSVWTSEFKNLKKPCLIDLKTYSQNSKEKRLKCYKQLSMYANAVEYLTGEHIIQKYEIWLPHEKKGKLIDLSEEFENDR